MRHIQLYSLVNRRQHRKTAALQSLRRRFARLALGCGVFLLLGLVALILAGSLVYTSLVDQLPSLSLLPAMFDPTSGELMQPTRLYDRSGQELLYTLEPAGITRRYLSLDPDQPEHISPELVRVAVGMLDPGFWQAPGFSLHSLVDPQPVTIAERLVDDLLLWQEPRGLRRALRMRLLAAQVISRYGHVQVLEWYLNSAYFGHLAYGADSAARLYLNRSAGQLDLAEAALVIAAVQAPALNPQDAPAAALEQRRAVLDNLLRRGVIPKDEYLRAVTETLALAPPVTQPASPAAAFSRLVIDQLAEKFGRQRLERGGLRIITTLDYDLQLELSCLSHTQLARLAGLPDDPHLPGGKTCLSARLLPTLPPDDLQIPKDVAASAVVYDPRAGQVLAYLGDTTLNGESELLTPREPGSLLTPFVALAGFARGMGPASLSWDIPANVAAVTTANLTAGPVVAVAEAAASHPNPDGKFHGPVRLRVAIANDYLAPLAQLLAQIGPSNLFRQASAMGLSSLSESTDGDLLYSGGRVSPVELAQAYGIFATLGTKSGQRFAPGADLRPSGVLYVEDEYGAPLLDARTPETQTVVTPQLAYLVHDVLRDDTARWPSQGYPNPLEIGRPAGAKIGQVEGGRQVWAAGYTPQRVVVFSLSLSKESSARLAPRMVTGMWHALMQYATRDLPVADWTEPGGISHLEVCDPSGLMPTEACPKIASEVFLRGSEPTGPDPLYQVFQINSETGRLATVFTPAMLVEDKTFLVVPQQARAWAQDAQLPLPPQEYDAIQPPEPSPDVRITAPALYAFVSGKVTLQGTAAGQGFQSYQVQVGQGVNPQTWLQVGQGGTSPVVNGVLGVWDTRGQNGGQDSGQDVGQDVGQDGLYSVRLQVVRSDHTAETAAIQVTVDNTPPLVRIPYPLNGQEFQAGQGKTITFQADASDAIGIRRLVWLVDGKLVGESTQAPYVYTWLTTRGAHTLEVKAYDLAGNEGKSDQVHFSLK